MDERNVWAGRTRPVDPARSHSYLNMPGGCEIEVHEAHAVPGKHPPWSALPGATQGTAGLPACATRSRSSRHRNASWRPPRRPSVYRMNGIHLTDEELETARHALQAYLQAFGHDEAQTVGAIRRVIAKLAAAQVENEEPRITA
jgi:hypothetical protein